MRLYYLCLCATADRSTIRAVNMHSSPPNSKAILFIDGYDTDRHYYAQRLKQSCPDLHIYEAASGEKGLELYSANVIDCVILELELPDISGFEVLVKLVPIARAPELPVIVLTQLCSLLFLQVAKFEWSADNFAEADCIR